MVDIDSSLTIVGDFLILFYHDEPDDLQSAIDALEEMKNRLDYRQQVAKSFIDIMSNPLAPNTLKELILFKANRWVANDEEAQVFLKRVYSLTLLDLEIDPNHFKE